MQIIMNKIFTGEYLEYNLGHELVNFIVDDTNKRYIYVNPLGRCPQKKDVEYVFHIMGIGKGTYNLVAVSQVDTSIRNMSKPKYKGWLFEDIFEYKKENIKANTFTFLAKKFYKPTKQIEFKVKQSEAGIIINNDDKIMISLQCNPLYNNCYATANDIEVIEKIKGFLKEETGTIDLSSIADEQCYSNISGRVNLEVSMSNLIAYFANRDKTFLHNFITQFLGVRINDDEHFDVVREEQNIDLLFKSKNHIIVIENKIDSNINGVILDGSMQKQSQLSKYYKYITTKYIGKNTSFFILAPKYNHMDLNNYENGAAYTIKSYSELFHVFSEHKYSPIGGSNEEGKFLFAEFLKTVQYLTWTKPQQREQIAYIRLKQRLKELEFDEE